MTKIVAFDLDDTLYDNVNECFYNPKLLESILYKLIQKNIHPIIVTARGNLEKIHAALDKAYGTKRTFFLDADIYSPDRYEKSPKVPASGISKVFMIEQAIEDYRGNRPDTDGRFQNADLLFTDNDPRELAAAKEAGYKIHQFKIIDDAPEKDFLNQLYSKATSRNLLGRFFSCFQCCGHQEKQLAEAKEKLISSANAP
ncbi:MAG: hypothetical protein ABI597_02730 [Gammaproteobacteria bacterium]